MNDHLYPLVILLAFVLLNYYLAYVGSKKTVGFASFSIGNHDFNPILVGLTMAASTSSTATFVIYPGFVYTHGVSAFIHFGLAAFLGGATALFLIVKGFFEVGKNNGSVTVPGWIYARYQNRPMAIFFALANLLSICFIILILVGCSHVLNGIFQIGYHWSLISIIVFVFSYTTLGGAYAHAYTNAVQGLMMAITSIVIFITGVTQFNSNGWTNLELNFPGFTQLVNPNSSLFNDMFTVFICGFIVTFALILQPHILSKILFLKEVKERKIFLTTTLTTIALYILMLFVGIFAKDQGLIIQNPDQVVSTYIHHIFQNNLANQSLFVFISVAILSAGLSSLDGVLVALSSSVVNDVIEPVVEAKFNHQMKNKLFWTRIILVIVALISTALAWNPPRLVGLFFQKGVYGFAAATVFPIIGGSILKKTPPIKILFLSSLLGLLTHFILHFVFDVLNPAVSGTIGILTALAIGFGGYFLTKD